jgi:hypothetical protein
VTCDAMTGSRPTPPHTHVTHACRASHNKHSSHTHHTHTRHTSHASHVTQQLIEHELEGFGIRLNKKPPNITFKKKDKGGINFTSSCQGPMRLDLEAVKAVCAEYKCVCAGCACCLRVFVRLCWCAATCACMVGAWCVLPCRWRTAICGCSGAHASTSHTARATHLNDTQGA